MAPRTGYGILDRVFNGHSLCRATVPERAIVLLSADGFYGTFSSQVHAGNIFDESQPQPTEPRYGSFRSVTQIEGRAYAVGLRGMVYRLDLPASWTRIDEKLARDFDAEAIDGFSASDLYVAGFRGELWQSDGQGWVPPRIVHECKSELSEVRGRWCRLHRWGRRNVDTRP